MPRYIGLWHNDILKLEEKVEIDADNPIEAINALLLYIKHWTNNSGSYSNIDGISEIIDNKAINFKEQLDIYKRNNGKEPDFLKWNYDEIYNMYFHS